MENIAFLLLGLAVSAIGIMNIKGNINTVHSYNRRKVTEEDKPRYGKTIGAGTLIIGISLILSFIVSFWNENAMAYVVAPGMVIGFVIILYGQFPCPPGAFIRAGLFPSPPAHPGSAAGRWLPGRDPAPSHRYCRERKRWC